MCSFQKPKSIKASRSSRYNYYIHNNAIHKHGTMLAQIIKALDRLLWSPYGLRSVVTRARYEAGLGLPNNQNVNNFLIANQTIYIPSDLMCVD